MSKRKPVDYNRVRLMKALYLAGYPAKDIGSLLGEKDYKINGYLKKEEDLKMRTPIESRRVPRVPYSQLSDAIQELVALYTTPDDLDVIYKKWKSSHNSNNPQPKVPAKTSDTTTVSVPEPTKTNRDSRGTFMDLTNLLKDCFTNLEYNTLLGKFTPEEPVIKVKVPNDQGERTTITLDIDNNEFHQVELKKLKQGSLRDIYYEVSKTYEEDMPYEPSDYRLLNEYLKKMTSFLKVKYPELAVRGTIKLESDKGLVTILFKLRNKGKDDKK